MVREVRDAQRPDVDSSFDESGQECFEEIEARQVAPLTKQSLIESFGRWVAHNPKENFDTVLRSWIAARRSMKLPVNPDSENPETSLSGRPTKALRDSLKTEFEEVRKRAKKRKK